jgi:hypothetical protein
MESGVTQAQIEAIAQHTPKDRSLVVSFDVLQRLSAGGMPVARAVAQVESKLSANASDSSILSLTSQVSGSAAAGSAAPKSGASAAGNAAATTGATAKGVGTVTGTATTTVKGVIKP